MLNGGQNRLPTLPDYRHRYVKPSIQRFISEDPIGLAGGSNLYGYVGDDPVNWVDPLGEALEGPGTLSPGPTGGPISGPYSPGRTTSEKLGNRAISKILEKISGKTTKIDPKTGKVVPNPWGFCIYAIFYSEGLAECQTLNCP